MLVCVAGIVVLFLFCYFSLSHRLQIPFYEGHKKDLVMCRSYQCTRGTPDQRGERPIVPQHCVQVLFQDMHHVPYLQANKYY